MHSIQEQHTAWLEDIRNHIWDRINFENEMTPSTDALYLHWQRSCWVLHMWRQADQNNMILEPITNWGWQLVENRLTIIWDTPENIAAIRDRVQLLLRGCKCATGCNTGRCGCRKKQRECSEGCECRNCLNMSCSATYPRTSEPELAEIAVEESVAASDILPEDTEELVDWVFGGEDTDPEEVEDEDYESS